MSQVIIFNPTSSPVANLVTSYKRSVQAVDYSTRNDAIIYYTDGDPPDVAALRASAVPMSLWKVSGGTVVELTSADKAAIAQAQAEDDAAAHVAALANLKQQALDYYNADQDALQKSLRAAIETVLELTVTQLNTLRAQHSLAALTAAQVKTAFYNTYQTKINAIT